MVNKVSIAAVQFKWKMEDYKNRASLQSRINIIMDEIRSKVDRDLPLLVAFPEDMGTPILLFDSYSIIKDKASFAHAVQSLIAANLPGVLKYKLRYGVSFIRSLLLSKGPDMEREYINIFSNTSKKYNAYIAAGSITLPDIDSKNNKRKTIGKDVYNVSYFFEPDGNIIGKQKKVYLVDFEGKAGFDLSSGSIEEISVFDTPFGKVGIAICLDAFKEDVCEKLSDAGADILIQPSANNGVWSEWQQNDWLNGSYLASQIRKKFKYALNPMMNGNILDLSFEGQSSIISSTDTNSLVNYSQLKPVQGFDKLAKHHNTEEILISTIEI